MSLRVTMQFKDRNLTKEWPQYAAAMTPYLQKTHDAGVLGMLADFVAWSRVDTGRMRAGWFPMLIKHGYPYQQFLGSHKVSAESEQEGISTSNVTENPFHTIIENGVYYTQYVEREYGVFDTWSGTEPSSFMKAPVQHIDQAMLRMGEKLYRDMQASVDAMATAWNNGAGNYGSIIPPTNYPNTMD